MRKKNAVQKIRLRYFAREGATSHRKRFYNRKQIYIKVERSEIFDESECSILDLFKK